jgi:hypothetical protein
MGLDETTQTEDATPAQAQVAEPTVSNEPTQRTDLSALPPEVQRELQELRTERGRLAKAQATIAEMQQLEEQRKLAELSELDRAKAQADAATQRAQEAETRAQAAEHSRLRAEAIAEHGSGLPPVYHSMVGGETEAEFVESIGRARTAYQQDIQNAARQLATQTVEELAAALGQEHPLVQRLQPTAASIGAPAGSAAVARTPVPYGSDALNGGSLSAWQARAERRAAGPR